MLLNAALPLLVLCAEPEQCSTQTSDHHSFPVLASLQCYNDFTTQMRCTWEEEPHMHTHLHMPISNGELCVSDGLGKLQSSGKLTRSCVYETWFSMGSHDVFFNISCPSKTVNDIGDTKIVIKSQVLFPTYSYEARVRARGSVGLWSDWSPTVVWMTEEEGVINLHCEIKELGVTCSWQVIKWQAEFLSYHLCGYIPGASVKCNHCDSHAKHPHHGTFLDFTCSLDSPKPELLTVEIRSLRKTKRFSDPDNNLSTNVPSSLRPSTGYMARVRALPGSVFAGRPSDWSDPVYFTTDPAPWTETIIYVLIAALVAVLFIILFNALPACHSFSECPLLKCGKDVLMKLDVSESGWPQNLSHPSLFKEGSKMTDKSGVSFSGPYILCCEDSSVPSDTSDTFCSPLLTFTDDDERCLSDIPNDTLPIKGSYILSPPKNPTSECLAPIDKLASENKEARRSNVPDDDPPAYTPSPAVGSSAIFSHPSGYCLMPNMERVEAWVSTSVPPLEGNTERRLHELKKDSPKRGYVTLSQRGMV
ncbi:hypothetical protein Baya_5525 [Bagarius yarrelli]|uniref:Uncharacterized protein n=1 Tax=Bagarius yarrelli TaxID=175774 RepID=A0A556TUX4_BAGYA|nr:hypothetical protein Baya_5525 [Bagarius yarrelli]